MNGFVFVSILLWCCLFSFVVSNILHPKYDPSTREIFDRVKIPGSHILLKFDFEGSSLSCPSHRASFQLLRVFLVTIKTIGCSRLEVVFANQNSKDIFQSCIAPAGPKSYEIINFSNIEKNNINLFVVVCDNIRSLGLPIGKSNVGFVFGGVPDIHEEFSSNSIEFLKSVSHFDKLYLSRSFEYDYYRLLFHYHYLLAVSNHSNPPFNIPFFAPLDSPLEDDYVEFASNVLNSKTYQWENFASRVESGNVTYFYGSQIDIATFVENFGIISSYSETNEADICALSSNRLHIVIFQHLIDPSRSFESVHSEIMSLFQLSTFQRFLDRFHLNKCQFLLIDANNSVEMHDALQSSYQVWFSWEDPLFDSSDSIELPSSVWNHFQSSVLSPSASNSSFYSLKDTNYVSLLMKDTNVVDDDRKRLITTLQHLLSSYSSRVALQRQYSLEFLHHSMALGNIVTVLTANAVISKHSCLEHKTNGFIASHAADFSSLVSSIPRKKSPLLFSLHRAAANSILHLGMKSLAESLDDDLTDVMMNVLYRDFTVSTIDEWRSISWSKNLSKSSQSVNNHVKNNNVSHDWNWKWKYIACIVEPRMMSSLEYSVRNIAGHLDSKEWILVVFYSQGIFGNEHFVRYIFSELKFPILLLPITIQNLDPSYFNYNQFLKSESFWSFLAAISQRTMIFQADSLLLKPFLASTSSNWNQFLMYDYIGAPWHLHPAATSSAWLHRYRKSGLLSEGVGNGGLSLRNPSIMAAICKENNRRGLYLNEDLFFVLFGKKMFSNFQLAPRNVSYLFAHEVPCDDLDFDLPFGVHNAWSYSNIDRALLYFKTSLIGKIPL